MKRKYSIAIIGYTVWCGLGFIRGANYYKYINNKYDKNNIHLYSDSFMYGIYGILMYANPLLLPITIHKELYRLEIDIRNLENEKKSDYYNYVI